jgi:hypothetical protein
MTAHTKIDLEQLAKEIRDLKPRQSLYIVLKRELSKIGYWKGKARYIPTTFINYKTKRKVG